VGAAHGLNPFCGLGWIQCNGGLDGGVFFSELVWGWVGLKK
jgi:hypothetical protein